MPKAEKIEQTLAIPFKRITRDDSFKSKKKQDDGFNNLFDKSIVPTLNISKQVKEIPKPEP